jgi:hypothetical protein
LARWHEMAREDSPKMEAMLWAPRRIREKRWSNPTKSAGECCDKLRTPRLLSMELIRSVLEWLGCFLRNTVVIGWATIGAEVLVAWVIYLELEHGRQSNFYSRTTHDKSAPERASIYRGYMSLEIADLDLRSEEFKKLILGDGKMRKICDDQIVSLNELGFIAMRRFALKRSFITLFPHMPIFIWIILRPYILRRREDRGGFFAQHMLRYTESCLKFVIKRNRPLILRSYEPDREDVISVDYMKKLRKELKQLL